MGQGAAEARLFAAQGARVAVTDIADTTDVATELGDLALALSLDVTQAAQWAGAVAATVERFGRLDILVNNAGIGFPPRPLGEEEMEHHYKVWAVNADGVYLGIRAVAPVMSSQCAGSIVNISSIDGLDGVAGMMSYTASKFAVTGMTKTAALELRPLKIRVNSVHPGGVRTPLTMGDAYEESGGTMDGVSIDGRDRWGEAAEIANLIWFLTSDESSFCTGAQFVADDGATSGVVPAMD